jgi:phosphoribosylformylglycinamidine cyclo-ligase
MLRVFNMGIGMVLIVAPDQVDRVSKHFAQIGQQFFFMGNVVKGSGRVLYDAPPPGFASWIE